MNSDQGDLVFAARARCPLFLSFGRAFHVWQPELSAVLTELGASQRLRGAFKQFAERHLSSLPNLMQLLLLRDCRNCLILYLYGPGASPMPVRTTRLKMSTEQLLPGRAVDQARLEGLNVPVQRVHVTGSGTRSSHSHVIVLASGSQRVRTWRLGSRSQ